MYGTHTRYVWNLHETRTECTRDASVKAQNLAIELQQDLINCHPFFARRRTHTELMQDMSRTRAVHLGCIRGAFRKGAKVTLELSCTITQIFLRYSYICPFILLNVVIMHSLPNHAESFRHAYKKNPVITLILALRLSLLPEMLHNSCNMNSRDC